MRGAAAIIGWALAVSLAAGTDAEAQQRPLITQDPEVIGAGRLLLEAGLETGANAVYPVSGLTGDRVAMPIGLSVGLGAVAELQIDGGYQWLAIDERTPAPLAFRVGPGERTADVIDVTVATKVRLIAETARRPAVAVRFATELPNASNENGLGLDTMNFFTTLLAGKTRGPLRVVGNAGLALLTDALDGSVQRDALVAGASLTYALRPSLDVVAELTSRRVLFADVHPISARPRGQARTALRYTRGAWRADAGVIVGTTEDEPSFGVTAGMTWIAQVR